MDGGGGEEWDEEAAGGEVKARMEGWVMNKDPVRDAEQGGRRQMTTDGWLRWRKLGKTRGVEMMTRKSGRQGW